MGLLASLKEKVTVQTKAERKQQARDELSATYPETPDGTFRCGDCGAVKDIDAVGSWGMKETEPGQPETVMLCSACATVEKR